MSRIYRHQNRCAWARGEVLSAGQDDGNQYKKRLVCSLKAVSRADSTNKVLYRIGAFRRLERRQDNGNRRYFNLRLTHNRHMIKSFLTFSNEASLYVYNTALKDHSLPSCTQRRTCTRAAHLQVVKGTNETVGKNGACMIVDGACI